nr:hypothetical protein [Marispirochaeta sp.]
MAIHAIVFPPVGIIILVKPSPYWKAIIATCLEIWRTSNRGANSGITIYACPDPDGTHKLIGKMIQGVKTKTGKMGAFCPKSAEIVALERTGTPCWPSKSFKPGKQTQTNP